MNPWLRISGACSVVVLLASLAGDVLGQAWTSASTGAAVVPTAGTSDAGPSLGNTQSQWTPRFQPPRTRFKQTNHNEAIVDADDAPPDPADGPGLQKGYRTASRGTTSAQYLPPLQRSSRQRVTYQAGSIRSGIRSGLPSPRVAQGVAPGTPGLKPSPFVEDEIVPQGKRAAAPAPDGEVQYQNEQAFDGIADGTIVDGDDGCCGPGCNPGGCNSGGGNWCDGGWCNDGCCDDFGEGAYDPSANERFFVCSPIAFLNELSFNAGVQAFKAPVDNGRNSNFGAHVGFNAGDALWHWRGIGYQVGAQYVESNFYGDQSATTYDPNSRRQTFVTAGLFHRAFYNYGWQGGVVVDYLNDHYYYNATMYQLRAELSFVFNGGHELGSWITAHTRNAPFTFLGTSQSLEPVNMYSLFYRRTFASGTQGRIWAGFTNPITTGGNNNNASAMVGADYRLVLSNRWDFTGVVNYLPSTQGGSSGQQAEAWAMSMNLVFYPARYARGVHNGPYRPLFNVADNTMFIVNRKQ